jgi:hypothetical protein
MVRFSDLLGGGNDKEDRGEAAQATISAPSGSSPDPYAALAGEPPSPDEEPVDDTPESPEEILERLTEYARALRAETAAVDVDATADAVVDVAEAEPSPGVDLEQPIADDLLPRRRSR